MAKQYYMACLDLEGRDCLVVGSGPLADEKAQGLLDAGGLVTVVAADRYVSGDLDGRFLVVAATEDEAVNRRVFADAEAQRIFCNVVDVPELCTFILPAIHRQGPIAVAVSSGGASPALAQRIRDEVAALVGPQHAQLAVQLEGLRPWAKRNLPTYEERRDFFRREVERALG